MLSRLMHKLEILWVVVTYAEAGETDTALKILEHEGFDEAHLDHHEYAQMVR